MPKDDLLVDKDEVLTSSIDNADVSPSPSPELESKLEAANLAFGHAKESILSAYHQALSEGFLPSQAKELLFARIKMVGRRTIYLYLPDEAKDKNMQRVAKRLLQNCSDPPDTPDKENKSHSHQMTSEEKTTNLASGENYSPSKVILNSKLADIIHDCVRSDKSNGYSYKFVLTHDGRNVSSVEDYESKDVSPSSISVKRDESDSKSKDVLLYPGHSEFKPTINEINYASIECPDCKDYVLQIQELKEALKAYSVPITAETQLAVEGQTRKEFEILVNIDEIQQLQNKLKTSELRQVLVTAYLNTVTGKVLSVSVGEPHDTI